MSLASSGLLSFLNDNDHYSRAKLDMDVAMPSSFTLSMGIFRLISK